MSELMEAAGHIVIFQNFMRQYSRKKEHNRNIVLMRVPLRCFCNHNQCIAMNCRHFDGFFCAHPG